MVNRLTLPILVLAVLYGSSFGAQDVKEAASQRMRIHFSALDKQEKPVLGLTANNFELQLDGRRAELEDFRPGLPHTDRSIPLVLWILVDWNPNIDAGMIRRQADAAAQAFNLFSAESVIGVKLVSDRSETLQPLAHDPAGLRRAFAEFSQRRDVLSAGGTDGSIVVGPAGILGAADHAIDEMVEFSMSDPTFKGREVHRAIMIISDGNVNPYAKEKTLYKKAAKENVFFYPVFVPRAGPYGLWIKNYFDLANKTGGTASVIGALSPGSKILPLPRGDTNAGALTFNFIHMARDLNGKYSFVIDSPAQGKNVRLDLRAKVKDVQIRLPRTSLP